MWHAMSSIPILPVAHQLYLDIYARCKEQYGSTLVANYVADEIRRIVLAISLNAKQPGMVTYRIPRGNPITDFWFLVVIPTPTGYDYDAAIVWTFRQSDGKPVILEINLEYRP